MATEDVLYVLYHPIFLSELFTLKERLQQVCCARVCLAPQLQLTVHCTGFGKALGAKELQTELGQIFLSSAIIVFASPSLPFTLTYRF